MKSIKAIKESKTVHIGDMPRLSDLDAEERVRLGSWMYISKAEYKKGTTIETAQSKKIEEEKKEKTLSKKAEKHSKLKEKQR